MVDQLNGKIFKLDLALTKNFDKFLAARGSPPELVKKSLSSDSILAWTVSGDQYTAKVTVPVLGHETTQTFKIGQEIEQTSRDGLAVKSVWTRNGNKLIETQTTGEKTFTITHDYSNAGIAHLTFVSDSVTATQVYKAI